MALLTADYHVYPDFHGNRSPLADPAMTGALCGLTIDCSVRQLAKAYLATIQALAYGTRHIVEAMAARGQVISVATICGGLAKSSLFVQTHCDVLGLPVVRPRESESVLLGAAMLGAAAASEGESTLLSVLARMGQPGDIHSPDRRLAAFHEKKYKVFKKMSEDQIKYRNIMNDQI